MGCCSSFLRYSNVSASIAFAAVIHGVSGMFYYGMDRLHRYIQENHNLDAAIQSALDIAPTGYFPQVIATPEETPTPNLYSGFTQQGIASLRAVHGGTRPSGKPLELTSTNLKSSSKFCSKLSKRTSLKRLQASLVNMSGIPDGLQSPAFPPAVNTIQLCGTNLTSLPLDIFQHKWSRVVSFALERSPGITEFPRALILSTTDKRSLSVAGNSIQSLPEDTFVVGNFYQLFLTGNPLQTLPDIMGSATTMAMLYLGSSNISALPPSWTGSSGTGTQSARGLRVVAGNTPLCERLLDEQARNKTLTKTLEIAKIPVDCTALINNAGYYFPLEQEKQWRERNRY
ncbi:hypothetical protein FI667_g646, partial [Globisporangium splendens]